jgi:type 2 lantibiotic biosynthesis protein LanM
MSELGLYSTGYPASIALSSPAFDPTEWLTEAQILGERIRLYARRTSNGEVVWLDPEGPASPNGRPALLGPHLYSGSAGVALFFAALEHVVGEGRDIDLVLGTVALLRRQIARLADTTASGPRKLKLGGLIGLGSYIYVFLRIARWLDQPQLTTAACEVAALITPERIAADEGLDVMYGSAGAIMALLLLDREAPETEDLLPIERAVTCGEHLLRRRLASAGEPGAWPANGRSPLCGFAHGAAGIAAALARLADRTGREDFLHAAREGLEFERRHYDSGQKNWRLLHDPLPSFSAAWCAGASGIALGRLCMPPGTRDNEAEAELELGLATTANDAESPFDYLCCGDMGRVDVLLEAARRLSDNELRRSAWNLAGQTLARARTRDGCYRWPPSENAIIPPSFFTGASGVGYGLLRLAAIRELPCVLCLE